MRAFLLTVLAVGLLSGCASGPPPQQAPAESVAATPAAPQALTYPAIGINQVALDPTGLDSDGELAVPPLDQPAKVVFANWGPKLAGEMPTLAASHVNGRAPDGRAVPGGFARLAEAKVGDEITLTRADDTSTRYVVRAVDTVDKDVFPTERVYAPGPPGRLQLVTCGGRIDHAARSYEDNVLVSAEAVS